MTVLWIPTPTDVGSRWLRARTRDDNGVELGTFTSATRPSLTEVQLVIQQAAGDVAVRTGDVIPVVLEAQGAALIALRAAMLIELGYFPEQVETGQSAYLRLKELYDETLTLFVTAVQDAATDGVVDGATDVGSQIASEFPVDTGGMIGYGTQW